MLKKATRKMFLDHNWEYIQKHDSNPSQKWTRIRDRANTLLHDLALLAEKLPDEKLQEIFTDKNMDALILRLLKFAPLWPGVPIGKARELDAWRTLLSARLSEKCLHFCMNQYELLEEDIPEFAEENIEHLKETIKKCKEIANGVQLRELKNTGAGDPLFNWNRVPGFDEKRLKKFVQEEARITDARYEWKVRKSRNDRQLDCRMIFEYGEQVPVSIDVRITLEKEGKAIAIFNQLGENNKLKQITLRVKDQGGQKFIYKQIR